jgi:hypothetical protein
MAFLNWITGTYKKRLYEFHEGVLDDKMLLGEKGAELCQLVK